MVIVVAVIVGGMVGFALMDRGKGKIHGVVGWKDKARVKGRRGRDRRVDEKGTVAIGSDVVGILVVDGNLVLAKESKCLARVGSRNKRDRVSLPPTGTRTRTGIGTGRRGGGRGEGGSKVGAESGECSSEVL